MRKNRRKVKTNLARMLVTRLRQLRDSYVRNRGGNDLVPKLYPDGMEGIVDAVMPLVAELRIPDGQGAWMGYALHVIYTCIIVLTRLR